MSEGAPNVSLLKMTEQIIVAYVGNNEVPAAELPGFIKCVFDTLKGMERAPDAEQKGQKAVSPKQSVFRSYIVCLEDGKRMRSLTRRLRVKYGMTPQQYRAKWGLPAGFPMICPEYAEQRSFFALRQGLGRSKQKALEEA